MKIGILGHYGDFNLGDEATIQAVIQNIRKDPSDLQPCCISVNPNESQNRHQVDSFPIGPTSDRTLKRQQQRADNRDVQPKLESHPPPRNFIGRLRNQLKQIRLLVSIIKASRSFKATLIWSVSEIRFLIVAFRILKDIDLLLIAGSNQCFDYIGGPRYFPFNLLKWSVLARFRGKRLAFVCVGAGPINATLSKRMLRRALALADYRSFRDETSRSVIDAIGALHSDDVVLPDLAFSLDTSAYKQSRKSVTLGDQIKVGINPMPLYDVRFRADGDPKKYSALVQHYADFVDWLLARNYEPGFFATHPKDILVVEDVVAQSRLSDVECQYPQSVDNLMHSISAFDVVLATRFHGVLLPYLLNIPVIGIAYWPKTKDLMDYMGQSQFLLSEDEFADNAEGFDLSLVTDRFASLVLNIDNERRTIQNRLAANRTALDSQYRQLWALLRSRKTIGTD